jgi:hypothetical protein
LIGVVVVFLSPTLSLIVTLLIIIRHPPHTGSSGAKRPELQPPPPHPNTLAAQEQVTEKWKNQNYQKIIATLSFQTETRKRLAQKTHIDENTIAFRLRELEKAGIIIRCGTGKNPNGRTADTYALNIG